MFRGLDDEPVGVALVLLDDLGLFVSVVVVIDYGEFDIGFDDGF